MNEWPVSPVPPKWILRRIASGYVLTQVELKKLQDDRKVATDLEYTDQNFNREARKYRAERQEEDRINAVHNKVAEKDRLGDIAKARLADQVQQQKEERAERERIISDNRDSVLRAKAEKQRATMDRIELQDRRAVVRDTIRNALVAKTRQEGLADRVMFNDADQLPTWQPSPGAYTPKPDEPRAACFANHPKTASRRETSEEPGPGAYDPKISAGIEYTFRSARNSSALASAGVVSPGPAAYTLIHAPVKGGKISRHHVKTDVEMLCARARDLPGPADYTQPINAGVSKSMGGRVLQESDRALKASTKSPGPGSYTEKRLGNIRGGAMAQAPRRGALPTIGPGPGDYNPTRTIAQERELEKLSKQVVQIMQQKEAEESDGGAGGGDGSALTSDATFLTNTKQRPPKGGRSAKSVSRPPRRGMSS